MRVWKFGKMVGSEYVQKKESVKTGGMKAEQGLRGVPKAQDRVRTYEGYLFLRRIYIMPLYFLPLGQVN